MKKINSITNLSMLLLLFIIACGGTTPESVVADNSIHKQLVEDATNTDSTTVLQAFEKLKTDKSFLKNLGLEGEKHFSWNLPPKGIIYGDLNKDGSKDALFPFAIEGRGGGNNWDFHYAIFLKKNNLWQYQSQFDANAGSPDFFYEFNEVKNGIIKGVIRNNNADAYEVPVGFILRGKELVNIYTALHKTDIGEREFLEVSEILNANNISIPLTATLKEYQKILGSGKIIEPEEQPECGTYFDEGKYYELQYPNLVFELNNKKQVAFLSLTFKNSGFKLQTNKGTITEKTTLNELKNVLQKRDNWWISDEEDGSGKSISIPTSENADDGWIIQFDKNGKIESVSLYIPC